MTTSQQQADEALAEHRAVMASLLRGCISRPTEDQYEDQLNLLREEMGKCVIFISDLPEQLSEAFSSPA